MSTPLGHSIIGYTIARAAGVRSRRGLALAMGAATLPDIDLVLGYVAKRDVLSLHHETITHSRRFPFLVGAAMALGTAGVALLRGRSPSANEVLRPAVLATALVGSHIAMDPLPLPYDTMPPLSGSIWEVVGTQAWNAVIDMAVYGFLAVLALERNGANGKKAEF